MSITKKYKKKKNYRRKTQSLLKKKNRKTRKKMIGGTSENEVTGLQNVEPITYRNLFVKDKVELIITVTQTAQGNLKFRNNSYTYLLLKDYKDMGPTIVCLKMVLNNFDINMLSQKDEVIDERNIHIEPLFTMRESDVVKKDLGKLIINLPNWKVVELINGTINYSKDSDENKTNNSLDTFFEKIYKFMNYQANYDIKEIIKKLNNKDYHQEHDTDDFKLATNLAIAASAVAGAAAIIDTLGDSSKLPLVGIITGGISLLASGIASGIQEAHEEQIEINKLLKEIKNRIEQLWTYIIEPLDKINELEKSLDGYTIEGSEVLSKKNENLSSLELTIAEITDPKVKNMVNEHVKSPDISVTNLYSSINTNQENILKLILDLLTTKQKYITRMEKLKQKGFYKFPLRHKISLNTHTKERIEYLSSALEKELLLLIQIINIKTNYNTLILLNKTEVQEALVREIYTARNATKQKQQELNNTKQQFNNMRSKQWTETVLAKKE